MSRRPLEILVEITHNMNVIAFVIQPNKKVFEECNTRRVFWFLRVSVSDTAGKDMSLFAGKDASLFADNQYVASLWPNTSPFTVC